ncbi:uncharacterized protein FPRO_16106 [Fusarium proliferatum ET1]|uniref:Uncharacterized protein n=1 Tax=Fusarium proliferatum (strain ET1) TaxID=1227346 RepID=A0A1L7WBA7_FUSPR|nr:uncharacterized protein FPRO_16106 [Fusarium proliferatum ET1]CZR49901.1 uncharacterized protein FPRO_16106 [Fusarium proliferatum ET1]
MSPIFRGYNVGTRNHSTLLTPGNMATRREILVALEDKKSIWDRIEAESQEGSRDMNPTMERFLSRWRENTAASEDMAKLASVGKGQTTPREPTNDIAAIIDRLGEADGESQMERIEHCHNETVKAPVDVLDANDNMTGGSERPARPGAPWPQRIEERAFFIPQYYSPKKLCHMASSVAPVCIAEEPCGCHHQLTYSSCPGHLGFPTTVPSSDYALQGKEKPGNLPPSRSIAFQPSVPRYELDNSATILTPDDTGRRDASGWSEAKTVVNVPSSIHLPPIAKSLQSGRLEARAQLKNGPRRVWTAEADLRRFHYSDKKTFPTTVERP